MSKKIENDFDDVFSSNNIPDKIESFDKVEELDKKSIIPYNQIDYDRRRINFQQKAKKTCSALLKFYLNEKIISKNDYIKQKANQDRLTLADLMTQVENMNNQINALMRTIDLGDVKPSMFEVLTQMQQTFMDLLKMKSMHLIQMQETVKSLVNDKEIYSNVEIPQNTTNENINTQQGITSRGTKTIMQEIQNALKNQKIEEAIIEK